MGQRTLVFLLLVFMQYSAIAAETANQDFFALKSLMDSWTNAPSTWDGSDPCGEEWDGIGCTNSRVTSIKLSSIGLRGQLSGVIWSLSELQILDLSFNKGLTGQLPPVIGSLNKLSRLILVGCGFSGSIPDTIGSLRNLRYLSLNSNSFSGRIPPSIGYLSELYWMDLGDNHLDGPIPVSNGGTPGLDMLLKAQHFHFGKNNLSDTIPPQLFSETMVLVHVLFESNKLTGSIPSTLGLVRTLEVVRFDRNQLSGFVPSNLSNLTKVTQLLLSNNKLTGPVPNLTGMTLLRYVDMSNNSFDTSDFPLWFSTLKFLTTLLMENTHLQGQIPADLFWLSLLQTLVLRENRLSGSLDIDSDCGNQLKLIDLQNNDIDYLGKESSKCKANLILWENPICKETEAEEENYCFVNVTQPNPPYSTPDINCKSVRCRSNQISSPNCTCAQPYTGILVFRAPSFSNLEDESYFKNLESSLMLFFRTHQLPVDSVSLSNPFKDPSDYLELSLKVFPSGSDSFNITGLSSIGFVFSNHSFIQPNEFGPYYFILNNIAAKSNKSSSIIIGLAAGGSIVLLVLLLAGVYAFRQKKRAIEQSHPFAQWDLKKSNSSIPELKGARWFSFEELQKCTNNFSEANEIGSGGYGKVYRGSLPTGQLIAVKRAQNESMQGGLEFKNEIELLSRVHHKNLVSLVGYCFQKGEQMLVYEFVLNGTLKDSLSGKSGIRLDWMRRLKLALGAARGLAYLHDFANPPIIHRDIKSNNILLDESLNAKVADFGLSKSKPIADNGKSHVSTQVKGTLGYLDPEYYMSNQLTEKSDVYSFGVLMLELITARKPIERGKYIVRVVKAVMDKTKDLYNLQELLDPAIGLGTTLKGLEKMVDLAMACVKELATDRPTMGEVVKEIENILQLAGLNPNADSASTSASYEEASKGSSRHPYSNEGFDNSGLF